MAKSSTLKKKDLLQVKKLAFIVQHNSSDLDSLVTALIFADNKDCNPAKHVRQALIHYLNCKQKPTGKIEVDL